LPGFSSRSRRLPPTAEFPLTHGTDARGPEAEATSQDDLHGGAAGGAGEHVQQDALPGRSAP